MLPENAAQILAKTFTYLLGPATPGGMAFVRCLPQEVTRVLAADPRFDLGVWQVAAVLDEKSPEKRWISADEAVEWRESKDKPVLLLVDSAVAGAGMDGIYSAAREIGETELFDIALEMARQELPHGYKVHAKRALDKARQLTRQRHLVPWPAFAYLCCAALRAEDVGGALPLLGLWPVAIGEKPDDADLDKAARMAERLFPLQGARSSAEQRVDALKLGKDALEVSKRLVDFLRKNESAPRFKALAQLVEFEEFWLNNLNPGLFDDHVLQNIEWINWRAKAGKPQAWSGLLENDEGRLELRLSTQADNPNDRARLEVRWKADPDTLGKGAVDFLVEVQSGQDVLAERTISHTGKSPQKAVFTQDDFEEIQENSRFEAQIVIRALGEDRCEAAVSEDFVLFFGETNKQTKSSSGKVFPTLALALAYVAPTNEDFKEMAREPGNPQYFSSDAKGFVSCRRNGKVAKIFSPTLLSQLGRDWIDNGGALGRWRVKIRADGTQVGPAIFLEESDATGTERLIEASKQMANWLKNSLGPLGVIYHHETHDLFNKYILAAMDAWKDCAPSLTLIHTLEVVSLSDDCLGLIVLPTHPLRMAWQQSFDLLVAHHRYAEGVSTNKLESLLEKITGAHYPAFLPGLVAGKTFVFADILGFHAAALVHADDPEPKATVALLGRLMGGVDSIAPTVGKGTATALGGEINRYLNLHPEYRRIQVHALRAGDAMPVARALSKTIFSTGNEEEGFYDDEHNQLSYELDLYPAHGQATELTGRFLSATSERRRTGSGSVPEEDRWLLESVTRPGGVSLPRLRWARRSASLPQYPAHLAIAFDVFRSRVECFQPKELSTTGTLEAYGLMLMPNREFKTYPTPHWVSYVPIDPNGEKHPVAGVLTKRQIGLHALILRATAKHLGGREDDWPALLTEVGSDQADLLQNLHKLCDWVITADRNAGIEYFDSPDALPNVYETYIIDCVPERDDLGFMQLITSTSSFEEVENLLDETLGEMGLSASPSNCKFLLNALKAVSGRLAMRLAGSGNAGQEMIAVALTHSHCIAADAADEIWLPLTEGFFVPLDDVPEFFRGTGSGVEGSEQRADLLYVSASKKGVLQLAFAEVKFRRYLKTARAPDLVQMIERQVDASCERWEQLFGSKIASLESAVNRAWLARILRFYANKGQRHGLRLDAFRNIMREIDRVVRGECDLPGLIDLKRIGFIFCPEYGGRTPAEVEHAGATQLWLFGPSNLPEPRFELFDSTGTDSNNTSEFSLNPTNGVSQAVALTAASVVVGAEHHDVSRKGSEAKSKLYTDSVFNSDGVSILLGHRDSGDDAVVWHPSIKSNPHLMILGLPGMGKTTALINICNQLQENRITPIVFSYHQDIDEKLTKCLPKPPQLIKYAGLGFNPMEVVGDSPLAYLDNVGMLRDIFSAIFPDLGDVQLGRLREALKTSYLDKGWGLGKKAETPTFRAFWELLQTDPKPDKGLLTRLAELDDYGFFDSVTGAPSIIDMQVPTMIQIHGTQNEYLQRAFATFVLYNLYQNMFRRGPQDCITHTVIFDEAHRAAKLKLIPTMVKECRKYGIAFVVASQEAKDFDPSLFMAVANYLALRLNETDAKLMAKSFAVSDKVSFYTDRIKQMPKYKAMYYGESMRTPVMTALADVRSLT